MIDAKVIVEKMKNQKINYDRVLQKMIQQWQQEETRPKILIILVVLLAAHIR